MAENRPERDTIDIYDQSATLILELSAPGTYENPARRAAILTELQGLIDRKQNFALTLWYTPGFNTLLINDILDVHAVIGLPAFDTLVPFVRAVFSLWTRMMQHPETAKHMLTADIPLFGADCLIVPSLAEAATRLLCSGSGAPDHARLATAVDPIDVSEALTALQPSSAIDLLELLGAAASGHRATAAAWAAVGSTLTATLPRLLSGASVALKVRLANALQKIVRGLDGELLTAFLSGGVAKAVGSASWPGEAKEAVCVVTKAH